MSSSKIKAVIFDCFGVLTGDRWKAFVLTLPEAQREPARELNRALDSAKLNFKEFLNSVHTLTGHSPQTVAALINAEMYKDHNMLDFIASLKPRYKIGLLSNVSSDWVKTDFLSAAEVSLFDDIFLSYRVGLVKPDPKIYQLCAEKLGVEVGECVLIDDGVHNCEGAEKAGMQAVLYKDFDQMKRELDQILTK